MLITFTVLNAVPSSVVVGGRAVIKVVGISDAGIESGRMTLLLTFPLYVLN